VFRFGKCFGGRPVTAASLVDGSPAGFIPPFFVIILTNQPGLITWPRPDGGLTWGEENSP